MSSKFGPRAIGGDGNDFRHRQRVASHYRESVVNKFRLKFVLCLHLMLIALVFLKVLEDLLDQFDLDWGPLERLNVPTPNFWEYWWLLSFAPALLAFSSLAKNNHKSLQRSYYGFFLLGLLPIAFGAGHALPLLVQYIYEPTNTQNLHFLLNFPMIVLEYAFFAISFQIHVFTMYFATQLIKAWQPASKTESEAKKCTDQVDKKLN